MEGGEVVGPAIEAAATVSVLAGSDAAGWPAGQWGGQERAERPDLFSGSFGCVPAINRDLKGWGETGFGKHAALGRRESGTP